ncbi:nipblb [Nucleospora cyclopteri]
MPVPSSSAMSIKSSSMVQPPISSAVSSMASVNQMSQSINATSMAMNVLQRQDQVKGIVSMEKSKVDSILKECPTCKQVSDILVYKEGNVYKDYSGKIEFQNINGQLIDKSGAFKGKDCGCSKKEIPSKGKLTDTGLIQDNQVPEGECKAQKEFMDKLVIENASMGVQASASVGVHNNASVGIQNSASSSGSAVTNNETVSNNATNNNLIEKTNSLSNNNSSNNNIQTHSAQSNISDTSNISDNNNIQAQSAQSNISDTSNTIKSDLSNITPSNSFYNTIHNTVSPSIKDNSPIKSTTGDQFPIQFKSIKLKYDLKCSDDEKKKPVSKINEKTITDYKTVSCIKTQTKVDTETKTVTNTCTLPQQTATITQKIEKPITQYKTITKEIETPQKIPEKPNCEDTKELNNCNESSKKPKKQVAEKQCEEPEKSVMLQNETKTSIERIDEKVITVNKTVVIDDKPSNKGIECFPDCPCEELGTCQNPCELLRCEIL